MGTMVVDPRKKRTNRWMRQRKACGGGVPGWRRLRLAAMLAGLLMTGCPLERGTTTGGRPSGSGSGGMPNSSTWSSGGSTGGDGGGGGTCRELVVCEAGAPDGATFDGRCEAKWPGFGDALLCGPAEVAAPGCHLLNSVTTNAYGFANCAEPKEPVQCCPSP